MAQKDWTQEDMVLRPMATKDAELLTETLDNLEISKWLMRVQHPYLIEYAVDWLKGVDKTWVQAVQWDGKLVGCVSCKNGRLGYWYAPKVWGLGLASFVGKEMTKRWFDAYPNSTMTSGYFLGNEGSRRVLEKCGFREVGRGQVFCTALQEPVANVDMEALAADFRQATV